MSEHIDKTIVDLQGKLSEIENEARSIKSTINQLCMMSDKPVIYSDAELDIKPSGQNSISLDEFYGLPLATAVRRVLNIRKATMQDAPATVREIYDALVSGGYAFDTKNEANAMRGLRISLSKNMSTFHRLPDGKHFGLLEWYEKVAKSMKNKKTEEVEEEESSAAESNSSEYESEEDSDSDSSSESSVVDWGKSNQE